MILFFHSFIVLIFLFKLSLARLLDINRTVCIECFRKTHTIARIPWSR